MTTTPSLWKDEKNWLVTVAMLGPEGDPGNKEYLDWIGRVFAFATVTNTRMLALRGDPFWPTYELWFSFISDNEKRRFINLVRDDGYADPDEDLRPPVSLNDMSALRPFGEIFPKDQAAHICEVAEITFMDMIASGVAVPWQKTQ